MSNRLILAIWALLLSGFVCLGQISPLHVPITGPLFVGGVPDTDSIIDSASGTGLSVSSITRSALNFGANVPKRVIVVTVGWGSSAAQRQLTSVTIGGTTATVDTDCTSTGALFGGCFVVHAVVAGTTGQSIVITWNGTIASYSYVAYRLLANSSIPTLAINNIVNNNGTTIISQSIAFNVVSGGTAFTAGEILGTTVGTFVYSGTDTLTTDKSQASASNTFANGSMTIAHTQLSQTMQFGPTPGTTGCACAVATWQ